MDLWQQLSDVTTLSIIVRILLAIILGGMIGLQRGSRNHPAGFRTHILVCVGACLAMLTNQYVFENLSALSDPTRLGAQVITGVGFLGVGTILITGRHRIKGLTTAAGLWASACMGLAIGIGFYSAAIIAGVSILIALSLFAKLEEYINSRSKIMDVYLELDSLNKVKEIIRIAGERDIKVNDMHFSQETPISGEIGVHMTLKLPKRTNHDEATDWLLDCEGVTLLEKI